jgi:hypothetical protein
MTDAQACKHAYIHTYIRTYVRTYVRTYTYMRIHTFILANMQCCCLIFNIHLLMKVDEKIKCQPYYRRITTTTLAL